jgi:hypothetical protein
MSIARLPRRNGQSVRQPRRRSNCDRAPVAAPRLIRAKHLLYPIQPILSLEECGKFSLRDVGLIFEPQNGNGCALDHNASSRVRRMPRAKVPKVGGRPIVARRNLLNCWIRPKVRGQIRLVGIFIRCRSHIRWWIMHGRGHSHPVERQRVRGNNRSRVFGISCRTGKTWKECL